MGCTPSKSTGIYAHDRVSRDLDTCSTFVPSLKSSVSTPERPPVCVETSGKQAFLNVPWRDVHGSVSKSSNRESSRSTRNSLKPRCPTHEPDSDTGLQPAHTT